MNEQDNRSQSEENRKHNATKKALKIIGIVCIVTGGIFAVIGFIDFFSSMGKGMPTKFWCLFIGIPLTAIGLMITSFAFKREISRYVKNESVPVINEAGREISPAIRDIASAVKDGFDDKTTNGVRCSCGEINAPDSKFCKKCGKSLVKQCPSCGEEISSDSTFCNYCGTKL